VAALAGAGGQTRAFAVRRGGEDGTVEVDLAERD
jgi:hypothetical protein